MNDEFSHKIGLTNIKKKWKILNEGKIYVSIITAAINVTSKCAGLFLEFIPNV